MHVILALAQKAEPPTAAEGHSAALTTRREDQNTYVYRGASGGSGGVDAAMAATSAAAARTLSVTIPATNRLLAGETPSQRIVANSTA